MNCIGDFTGRSRVDGRAVDKEPFWHCWGESRFEYITKYVFYVGRLWEDCNNRFLYDEGDGLVMYLETQSRNSSAMVSADLGVSEDWLCRKVCEIMARAMPKRQAPNLDHR